MMHRHSLLGIVVVRVGLTVAAAFMLAVGWGYAEMRGTLEADLAHALRTPDSAYVGGTDRFAIVLDSTGRIVGAASPDLAREALGGLLDRTLARLAVAGIVATLAVVVGSFLLTRKALGSIRDVAAQAQSVQGGTVGQKIHVATDVRESAELVDVLNDLLDRLDRAFEWQRRLIAGLGHDIRTPITVLRASAESALLRERSGERYREVIASSLEEVDRLALISDSLLLLARFEAGALEPRLEEVPIETLVGEIVARGPGPKGLVTARIDASAAAAESALVADRRMIGLAIEELIHNAIMHNAPGTAVSIDVTGDRDSLTLTVADDGAGVDADLLPRLFELGFRTDQARGRSGGAGLGLTVVTAVVSVHGGRLSAESSPGGGLRVRVTLPRRQPGHAAVRPAPYGLMRPQAWSANAAAAAASARRPAASSDAGAPNAAPVPTASTPALRSPNASTAIPALPRSAPFAWRGRIQ